MSAMGNLDFRSRNGSERVLALGLVALGVFSRVLPHPENVTPTAAIALFSGVALSGPLAFTVPLLVMAASDFFIGWHGLFWLVWPAFLLVTWLGQAVRVKNGAWPILLASFGGSILFFVLSNFGVFLFENMYPKSWAGLAECFEMTLPFFRNSLTGDLAYTAVIFSLFELSRRGMRAFQRA